MSRQVLSEKIKQSFNYWLGTMTCSSSKREKKYLVIWLKPVVGRMHQKPLASSGVRPGMPQDGQHWQGLWGSCPDPGTLWQVWQHHRGGPAPLGCCLGGHTGCRYSMSMAQTSPTGACWMTRAHPADRMVWGHHRQCNHPSLSSPGSPWACLIRHALALTLGTVA